MKNVDVCGHTNHETIFDSPNDFPADAMFLIDFKIGDPAA